MCPVVADVGLLPGFVVVAEPAPSAGPLAAGRLWRLSFVRVCPPLRRQLHRLRHPCPRLRRSRRSRRLLLHPWRSPSPLLPLAHPFLPAEPPVAVQPAAPGHWVRLVGGPADQH